MRLWLFILIGWVGLHFILSLILSAPITDASKQLQSSSIEHLLGTDYLGRDILSRSLHGGVFTLTIASLITFMTILFAVVISLIAEFSSVFNQLVKTSTQILLAFPAIVLILLFLALLPSSWLAVIIAVSFNQIPVTIMLIRPSITQSHYSDYSLASYAMGASIWNLVKVHILRDLFLLVMSYLPILFAHSIFYISAVAFLGLSPDVFQADWGIMLAEGREVFRYAPLMAIVPGTSITVTIFVLNRLSTAWSFSR